MDITLSTADTIARLGVAVVLGGLVGLERERLERAAGLRTHAVVALASALIMIVSTYGFSDVLAAGQPITLDPSRIAAQVISGIGLACGAGMLATAAIATGFVLIVQAGLRPLERRFFDHHYPELVTMRLSRSAGNLAAVESAVDRAGLHLRGLRLRPARGGAEDRLELDFAALPPKRASDLLDALRGLDGVRLVTYTVGSPRGTNGHSSSDDENGSNEDESTDL